MDAARLRAIATDPRRTRKDLEQMLANAKAQQNAEGEVIVQEVLQARFPVTSIGLDRDDPEVAAGIMESLFPRKADRTAILARLLKSCAVADDAAPNAWAVTLFPDYFRLNVGQVEVYVAYAGGFFLNCSASVAVAPYDSAGFADVHYKSVPLPQCRFRGVARDLRALSTAVEQAHARFICYAAQGPSGKPRAGSPLTKSHSEGLLKYARQLVGGAKGVAD
jgi:hypothetical protein